MSDRRQNGMSLNPLSSSEIESYCRLRGRTLSEWEVDAICELDNKYLESRLTKTGPVATGASALGQNVTGRKND